MVHPLIHHDPFEVQSPQPVASPDHYARSAQIMSLMEREIIAHSANRVASRGTCQIFPVLQFSRDGRSLPIPEMPEYFPGTVAEFLRMSVERVIYLLGFYELDVWVLDQTAEESEEQYRRLELISNVIASHYLRCLENIARAIGLKLKKVHSRKLERLRASPNQGP
ncbi:hypothetical protein TWF730_001442 [Orbilia blumenaviensis]|uniref:Uncharacterized protein n=1 Tax=Orbilia blumenaviensis TaxID=1796055 RepID=A0AAV9UNW9_9PEZI